jgi:hypothetical protein
MLRTRLRRNQVFRELVGQIDGTRPCVCRGGTRDRHPVCRGPRKAAGLSNWTHLYGCRGCSGHTQSVSRAKNVGKWLIRKEVFQIGGVPGSRAPMGILGYNQGLSCLVMQASNWALT